MPTWIALFRGVNVGGKNRLPMKPLASQLSGTGLKNVRTCIQSGNVVFETGIRSANRLSQDISGLVKKHHGFRPAVFVLTQADLERAIADNPFPEAARDGKTLHLAFLDAKPAAAGVRKLGELATASERFRIVGLRLYLHAPDGIGRSRFASGLERTLGVSATGRNWRTILRLQEMCNAR